MQMDEWKHVSIVVVKERLQVGEPVTLYLAQGVAVKVGI